MRSKVKLVFFPCFLHLQLAIAEPVESFWLAARMRFTEKGGWLESPDNFRATWPLLRVVGPARGHEGLKCWIR